MAHATTEKSWKLSGNDSVNRRTHSSSLNDEAIAVRPSRDLLVSRPWAPAARQINPNAAAPGPGHPASAERTKAACEGLASSGRGEVRPPGFVERASSRAA